MAHFIGIEGLLGAGKTTAGALLAHYYRNKVKALGGDLKLFSNFGLRGAKEMRDYTNWYDVADAHGSIIVWDEAMENFDSRKFSSNDNVVATNILKYCRKMASVQFMIAPNFSNIDTRVRQITEILIRVSKIGNKGIRLEYYDFQAEGSSRGRFLHSRFLPASKVKQIHSLKLFNTHAMVRGFPMPSNERKQKEFWDELEERHNAALERLGLLDDYRDTEDDFVDFSAFDIGEESEEMAV